MFFCLVGGVVLPTLCNHREGGGVSGLSLVVASYMTAVVSLLDTIVAQRTKGLRSWLVPVRTLSVQVPGRLADEHSLTFVAGPTLLGSTYFFFAAISSQSLFNYTLVSVFSLCSSLKSMSGSMSILWSRSCFSSSIRSPVTTVFKISLHLPVGLSASDQ